MKQFLTQLFRICLQSTLPKGEIVWMTHKDFFSLNIKRSVKNVEMDVIFSDLFRISLNTVKNWQNISNIMEFSKRSEQGATA